MSNIGQGMMNEEVFFANVIASFAKQFVGKVLSEQAEKQRNLIFSFTQQIKLQIVSRSS